MNQKQRRSTGGVTGALPSFLRNEASGGVVLLASAVAAFVWANLDADGYRAAFEHPLTIGAFGRAATFSFRHLINDGLMTVFFFVVGVEIRRELAVGELDTPRKAALPAVAALGGMIVPAAVFLAFTWGERGAVGWAIPMATDIAFSVGILTLLAERAPRSLVVFVTALAIFDDIGGILVIAVFYGGGIHVTLLGVALGLLVPARAHGASGSSLEPAAPPRWVRALEPLVTFVVVPLFALANAGVSVRGTGASVLVGPVALGAALGLLLGKPAGILAFSLIATRLGIATLPRGASLAKLAGASTIAGVGFTVALFIAALAYETAPDLLSQAKAGILVGSTLAAIAGTLVLGFTATRRDGGESS